MLFKFDSSNRKRFVFFALSVLAGLLDYLICDFMAWINHLPLFCDTIFIMALSFLAGPWWGVLAGFFYHLIDFILNRTLEPGHLFMLCHFLAALTAGYFKIRFIKKTDTGRAVFVKLIVLSIVLCLVMSVSGGIISYILSFVEAYNQASSQTDFLTFLWENSFRSKILLLIAVRLPVNFADRLICTFAAWGIFRGGERILYISGKL
ncbi:MAG: ECF transporter S component [Treponema succinifaciens]|uniref:ECF transporter S component n=1 Tax=Treponema succinifaciens TaxID=167 RepID=UPI002A76036C|nr:ECF transporter S component [Treponema succinifaciens]MDY2616579.1 ECF transporter S component [Treponema succinifaciens]